MLGEGRREDLSNEVVVWKHFAYKVSATVTSYLWRQGSLLKSFVQVQGVFGTKPGTEEQRRHSLEWKKTGGRSKQVWAGNCKQTNGLRAKRLDWDEQAAWRARVWSQAEREAQPSEWDPGAPWSMRSGVLSMVRGWNVIWGLVFPLLYLARVDWRLREQLTAVTQAWGCTWVNWVVPTEQKRAEWSWERTECQSFSGGKGKQTGDDSQNGSVGKQGRMESWCGHMETSCQGTPVVCGNPIIKLISASLQESFRSVRRW